MNKTIPQQKNHKIQNKEFLKVVINWHKHYNGAIAQAFKKSVQGA
jgi:hypothetical protein